MDNKLKRTIILVLCTFMAGCGGKPPTDIGVHNGTLSNCPDSPNCVVSQNGDEAHFIAPISYHTTKDEAVQKIKAIVSSLERTKLIRETDNYLYFEFKSRIMGYVDDVEFYFSEDSIIHVRSASRVGYGDLGVNRERIERVRALFN